MTNTAYFDLQNSWKQQDSQYKNWRRGLIKGMNNLERQVAEILGISDWTWKDRNTNKDRPYLTFYNFHE